jgi:hypothetical protein
VARSAAPVDNGPSIAIVLTTVALSLLACGFGGSSGARRLALTPRTVRAPSARERQQITASVHDVWRYEARRPNTIDEFFQGVRRWPPLRPALVKVRVLQANPAYATAVVTLLGRHAERRGGPWILVLHRGGGWPVRGGWSPLAGPAVDFALSCTRVTAANVRALMCPDPWTVVGYPRPHVHQQTTSTQPVSSPDVHRIDWRTVVLPGGVCGSSRPIRPRRTKYGPMAFVRADVNLPWWNPVVVDSWRNPTFGDLDGDGMDEAALDVGCANGGGTAAGQLEFSVVIFKADGKRLRALGVVPIEQPLDVRAGHVPIGGIDRIERGAVVTREGWYGPFDGCCPSGRASATWSYRNGRFVRTGTRLVTPVWTSPVQVIDVLGEPGDHELSARNVGGRRTTVPLTRDLHFDLLLENEGSVIKDSVKVTLTIRHGRSRIVRTRTIRRIVPWAVDDTVLHFTRLGSLQAGTAVVVIRIGLPGANPLVYPVRFTRR